MGNDLDLTVVIQAGGRSSRMGQDKGLVLLAGRPMIEHVLARVDGLGSGALITTNRPAEYAYLNLPMAADSQPGAGALPGLETALAAAPGDLVLLVACDMPFLNRALLEHLVDLAPTADVVVPRWGDRHQPMHAVYRRRTCLAAVRAALARNERRMISFYTDLRVVTIPETIVATFAPVGRSFFNVNTPAELAEAEQLYAEDSEP